MVDSPVRHYGQSDKVINKKTITLGVDLRVLTVSEN